MEYSSKTCSRSFMKQTANSNYQSSSILGIDVSKDELVIFDSAEKQVVKVGNNEKNLKAILSSYQWKPADYQVGIESTGDYSFLAMKFFLRRGFTVKLINPIVTKKIINSSVRGKKTDKSDAEAITDIILLGEGQSISEKELDLAQKTLLRLEVKLTSIKSNLKRISHSLQMKSDNGIDISKAKIEVESLIKEVEQRIDNIWDLAKSKPSSRQEEIISSHIGCGEKLSKIISEEAGDIKRFPSASQFKAYVGIDPKVIQSGKMDIKGKMTKRGNPILRHALFLASFVASRYDPDLKEYYRKKRNEGKSHTHAICTLSRKMCERIYATVTKDKLYQPNLART